MSEQTSLNLAYLAGIIDGEGSIGILKSRETIREHFIDHERYSLRLTVTTTSLKLKEWLEHNFPANLSRRKRNSKWSYQYDWYCGGEKAIKIISMIKPYLVIKREHADIAELFFKTFSFTKTPIRVPNDILMKRSILYEKLKSLNSRKGHASYFKNIGTKEESVVYGR